MSIEDEVTRQGRNGARPEEGSGAGAAGAVGAGATGPGGGALTGLSAPLSPRELEVLTLVGSGMTCKEISEWIGVSPRTVENHKRRSFYKLGVQNQAHAVAVAIRCGLIDGDAGVDRAAARRERGPS